MSRITHIVWRKEVPLLTNFYLFKTVAFVISMIVLATYLAIFLGLVESGIVKEVGSIGPFLIKVALTLFALFFIFVWLLLGNKYIYEYKIDDKGVWATGIDKKSKLLIRIAVLAGLTSGKPLLAGVSMAKRKDDSRFIPWSKIRKVDKDYFKAIVHVKRRFLDQIDLYCTSHNFNEILARVETEVSQRKTK